jgi:hypothetical protein
MCFCKRTTPFRSWVVIVQYTENDVQTWEASTFWPRFHITLGERIEKLQVVALTSCGLTKLGITKLHILPGILQGLAIAKTSRDISLLITSYACPISAWWPPNPDTTASACQESCLDNFCRSSRFHARQKGKKLDEDLSILLIQHNTASRKEHHFRTGTSCIR